MKFLFSEIVHGYTNQNLQPSDTETMTLNQTDCFARKSHGFYIVGCSFHSAHIWSKAEISIC